MIEFKDEILDGEPRYRVRGVDGNLIHDEAIIEMGTHVAQEGTPLNKPFFENIQAYIKSTDRYTPSNLRIAQIDSEYEKKFFPKTWERVETGVYKNGKKTIQYDSKFDDALPDKMFDGIITSGVGNVSNSAAYSHTIHFDYGKEIKITEFYVCIRTYIDTGYVKMQASKDNSSWVDIKSWGSVKEPTVYNIKVENPDWYRYYRFYVTGNYTSYVLYEWQTVTAITHETQILDLPLLLDTYDENKLINVVVPEGFDSTAKTVYMNINNLGNIPIRGTLKENTKYIFNYNNGAFDFQPAIYPIYKVSDMFSVKTGTVKHRGVIPKTAGYTHYMYFVSIADGTSAAVETQDYRETTYQIKCSVDQSTRVVTAQLRLTGWNQDYTTDATANYIELAWN